jgi:hypothetical protein
MQIDGYQKEERGPRLFHTWSRTQAFGPPLGDLTVALVVAPGCVAPDNAMLSAADELCEYVRLNGEFLVSLLFSSYRAAEATDGLRFWGVPTDLSRAGALSHVRQIELQISRHVGTAKSLESCISAAVNWDQEHGLHLIYSDGGVVSANHDEALLEALRTASMPATEMRLR